MTCVEVVEHLDPPELNAFGEVLLGRCKPSYLLVTTPNKEYNLNFMRRPDEWPKEGEAPQAVPPPDVYGVRNDDHRFEWTREEFRVWAEGLASAYGYDVSLHGIGGGPLDEKVPYGEWKGPGPLCQAAVFKRRYADSPMTVGVDGLGVAWMS